MEVVLYNDLCLEIARETVTEYKSLVDIIKSWIVEPGDTIKIF